MFTALHYIKKHMPTGGYLVKISCKFKNKEFLLSGIGVKVNTNAVAVPGLLGLGISCVQVEILSDGAEGIYTVNGLLNSRYLLINHVLINGKKSDLLLDGLEQISAQTAMVPSVKSRMSEGRDAKLFKNRNNGVLFQTVSPRRHS